MNENIPNISLKSQNSSNSLVTKQIREKLREISRFKTNQMSERIVNSQVKEIADRDIEPLLFIYENECPVEIQIWD